MESSSDFLGFLGKDMEATIDLGKEMEISNVSIHTFTQTASWIYPSKEMSIQFSNDGINFAGAEAVVNEKLNDRINKISFKRSSARFVRVIVKNFGMIPSGNPGAGNPAWLFVDEIEIE